MALALLVLTSPACKKWGGGIEDDDGPFKGMTAKQLYQESRDAIAKREYATAGKRLEALESMYPFSSYAEAAQLQLIYAYYENEEYASAAATAERFIHLYPRSKDVDYAYYMKGLANFQQTRGIMTAVVPLDESWRDPGTQSQAYADFSTFVQRFPNSRYKANAEQRLIYLRNMFAKRELNTAKYYFDQKMYVAAAERAGYLVKVYPQAASVREALVVLYRANSALGLKEAARDAARVYEATFHQKLAG